MGINLEKKKEAAGIVLAKRKIVTPPACEVGVAIDISGSMSSEYRDGVVQEIVERILALAMRFDQDGKLDFWTFSSGQDYIGTVSEDQVEDYVRRKVLNNPLVSKWGGTEYGPVLKNIYDKYFGSGKGFMSLFGKGKKTEQPVIVFFVTDGENSDHSDFERLLKDFRTKNIYIQIIGVGGASLNYVKKIAEQEPNVGFDQIYDVRKLSDEEMIEKMITQEFADWIKKF